MKKKLIIAGFLSAALLAGCAAEESSFNEAVKDISVEGKSTEEVTVNNETQTEAQPEVQETIPKENIDAGREVYDNLVWYLDGDWILIPNNSLLSDGTEPRDVFSFDYGNMTMTYTKADGDFAVYDFSLTNLFEQDQGAFDCLVLHDKDADKYGQQFLVGEDGASFQLFLADNNGWDYMLLRPVGKKDIPMEEIAMSYNMPTNGCYTFVRKYEEFGNKMETFSDPNQYRLVKDGMFYAIKWLTYGNSVTLQEVEIWTEKPTLFGMNEEVIAYKPIDDEYRNVAINYNIKGMENDPHDGFFDPVLVEVETNADGEVTLMNPLAYADEGYYYPYGDAAMDNTRDHKVYGAADSKYVGNWVKKDEKDSTLEIQPDSQDLGGYYLKFFLYRIADFSGNASLAENGSLIFEGTFEGPGSKIKGLLQEKDEEVVFTVTESEFEFVPVGAVYNYIKE
jgi:hypothetical protein